MGHGIAHNILLCKDSCWCILILIIIFIFFIFFYNCVIYLDQSDLVIENV